MSTDNNTPSTDTAKDSTDERSENDTAVSKRGVTSAAAGAGALAALAGCNGNSNTAENTTGNTNSSTESPTATPNNSGSGSGSTGTTQEITFTLNGEKQTFDVDPQTELLYVLRDVAGLHGPKFGCGLSECGACAVLVGDNSIRSCVTPVKSVEGQQVTTTGGLGTTDNPSALQQAFMDEQAAQCGYCISGMIIKSESLLRSNSNPSEDEIRSALNGHLCRCGTHDRIINAVKTAAENR